MAAELIRYAAQRNPFAMSESAGYKMIDELAESYRFEQTDDGGAQIVIRTSARFADLWLIKLNELTATEEEIEKYEPEQ